VFVFGRCTLDPERYELCRDGEPVHCEPQVLEVLAHLLRHADRVVPKGELLDAVWGSRFIGPSALISRVKTARRAIGDDGDAQRMIRTVRGRGYQFVGAVSESDSEGAPERRSSDAVPDQRIQFCESVDGVRIAFATSGEGDPLVKAANWMTHLGYDVDSPVWRHWLDALTGRGQLVRYDERGCGLSDWEVPTFGFEQWVQDLELVVDALALDRFPLLGVSQGGAVAIAYAARHPERVSRLVLVGAYAQGRFARARNDEERRAASLDLDLARVGWAQQDPAFRQVFASQFMPDGTRDEWNAFDDLQRRTTSPANAVRFLETFATIDVTREAREVSCPTLILHSRGDARVPLACASELASLISDSRLTALRSRNHLLTADEVAWPVFIEEVVRFLGEPDQPARGR
jgi:pimeloyl-ACP methyl ester carboxylesterase/DNA-binding winged helix-turn-helix (wHTH) protein